jgi:hypothetical protein
VNKWKIAGLVALGFVAGGVLGGLIGFAWHAPGRPATWGNVRAWATFAVLVLGFSVAAYELNLQRVQFARQAAGQEASDDLLERQQREIAQVELARQREQAENIFVEWRANSDSAESAVTVRNRSRRPITKIAAGVMVPLPDGGMETHGARWFKYPDTGSMAELSEPPPVLLVLKPTAVAEALVPHGADQQNARAVIRFYDDAGRRWQLDADLHLEPAPDDGW